MCVVEEVQTFLIPAKGETMKTVTRRFVLYELPINSDPDSAPPAAGACVVDEPECNDTGVLPDDANPLPPPSDATMSGGMVANGGLTVSEALVSDVGGVIAVQGFLFDDGSGPRLCETLAESFPPQCGGASLPVSGHEEAVNIPMLEEQGVTWTDQTLVLFGEVVGGTLVVDPTVTG
jgi:hypothetical protein